MIKSKQDGRLPYVGKKHKDGYHRVAFTMPPDVAEEMSAILSRIKARFPDSTMPVAWCLAMNELEDGIKAQGYNEHALEILAKVRDTFGHTEEDLPLFMIQVLKALLGCPTDTTVEFVGESEEYKRFWEQDDE